MERSLLLYFTFYFPLKSRFQLKVEGKKSTSILSYILTESVCVYRAKLLANYIPCWRKVMIYDDDRGNSVPTYYGNLPCFLSRNEGEYRGLFLLHNVNEAIYTRYIFTFILSISCSHIALLIVFNLFILWKHFAFDFRKNDNTAVDSRILFYRKLRNAQLRTYLDLVEQSFFLTYFLLIRYRREGEVPANFAEICIRPRRNLPFATTKTNPWAPGTKRKSRSQVQVTGRQVN